MDSEVDVLVVGPKAGHILTNPIGGRMILKVSDQNTSDAYSLHENILPPRSPGPRPHIHHNHDETFYVLEGELTMRAGTRTVTAAAGTVVMVPRGLVHQPSNPGPLPTRVLLLFSPGGMDQFFVEAAERRIPLQAVSTDPVVLEALAEFAQKYSFEFAEFPPDT